MKKLITLFLIILFALPAFAEDLYREDNPHNSFDWGRMCLAVRNDTASTTLTSANGDYSPIAVSNKGEVFVTGSITASAADKAEDDAHVSGATGSFVLAVRNDTASTTLTNGNGDYSPVAVNNKGEVFTNVSSSALPTGASTLAEQQTQTTHQSNAATSLSVIDDWDETDRAKVNPIVGQAGVAAGSGVVGTTTQRVVLATDVALPAGTNNIGDVDVLTEPKSATGTVTSVNDTNVSTTCLASNASRLGATVKNDSTVVMYVKFGATASSSSFTVSLAAGDYYEVPFRYTGIIDCIWASDASGAARITEMS